LGTAGIFATLSKERESPQIVEARMTGREYIKRQNEEGRRRRE
jgi:hypothetical protein